MDQITVRKISSSITRTFLPFGWTNKYEGEFDLQPRSLAELVTLCVKKFIPELASGEQILQDIKGGDANEDTFHLTGEIELGEFPPQQEELLLVAGEVRGLDEDDKDLVSNFSISVRTPFKEFLGPHHITHRLTLHALGAIPENISPAAFLLNLEKLPDISVTTMRLSADFFKSRLTAVLGFSPIVLDHLLIEASPRKGILAIRSGGMAKKDALPLTRHERHKGELVIESLMKIFALKGLT